MLRMTPELIRALVSVDINYTWARMEGIQNRKDNPYCIGREDWDSVCALKSARLDVSDYNRVLGMTSQNAKHLKAIDAFYNRTRTAYHFEFYMGDLDRQLAKQLLAKGWSQTAFRPVFLQDLNRVILKRFPKQIRIKEVRTAEEFEIFVSLYTNCWEVPNEHREEVKGNIRHLREIDEMHLFVSFVREEPAAVAILYTLGSLAYLADAATLPAYRGKGCHRALICRRLQIASELGCQLIMARPEFGSHSHSNMEKAGVPLALSNSLWNKLG